MTGLLKDDLTVALDEVGRTASRIVTIYDDLAAIAVDPAVATRLRERGERHRQALIGFNEARRSAGHTPEVGDPELAHLQSLWLALKSAVAGEHSEDSLQQSLTDLDGRLHQAIGAAADLRPEPPVRRALEDLGVEFERPSR